MSRSSLIARTRRRVASRGLRIALVAASLIAFGANMPSSSWTLEAQAQKPIREDLVQKLTGKKIRVDARTGRPRAATAAEARATVQQLTALLDQPTTPPAVSYKSNGTEVATVEGYLNRTVLARPLASGRFETRCVATLDEAVNFLSGESVAFEDR